MTTPTPGTSTSPVIPAQGHGQIQVVILDGVPSWRLKCPGCNRWGYIDDDQLFGRVSVDHTHTDDGKPTGCGFHETRNFYATAEWVT